MESSFFDSMKKEDLIEMKRRLTNDINQLDKEDLLLQEEYVKVLEEIHAILKEQINKK